MSNNNDRNQNQDENRNQNPNDMREEFGSTFDVDKLREQNKKNDE